MKKRKRLCLMLMACAILLCFVASCNEIDYDVFGSISGTVIDELTQDPVSGATVTLSPSGRNTYTGNDGSFEFLDLDARQYTITAQKTGYQTNRKTVTIIAGGNVDISLTLKKNQ